jgi:hypothetical protein
MTASEVSDAEHDGVDDDQADDQAAAKTANRGTQVPEN